jgi:hypothetical protein
VFTNVRLNPFSVAIFWRSRSTKLGLNYVLLNESAKFLPIELTLSKFLPSLLTSVESLLFAKISTVYELVGYLSFELNVESLLSFFWLR